MNKKISFGTDGIRGKVGQFPFTPQSLSQLGIAIAQWSISKYKKENPKVLIGHDTRISCPKIKIALKTGLCALPLQIIDAEILPTPAVCQLINKKNNFDFGIIISASHNPYNDNGIKIIDAKTIKINSLDEKIIVSNFENITNISPVVSLNKQSSEQTWKNAALEYKNNILSFFKPKLFSGIKVVLDCANGATYKIAPDIFESLGAEIITIYSQPNGKNINDNCGSLYPQNLQKIVLQNNADIGFAFDGDGDRVLVINKNGEILCGDNILALLSTHPKFSSIKTIIGTIMTNLGLDLYLKKNGKNLIRTKVGDKYVSAKLQENNLLLGGESCGHIIMKDYLNSGDGIFVALRILETIILTNNWEIKTFKKVPQILINVPVINKKDLSMQPYSSIIKKQKDILKQGRIVIRYSGTENLLRIMVENENKDNAIQAAQTLAKQLQKELDSI